MRVMKKIFTVLVSLSLMFVIIGICLLSSFPTFMTSTPYIDIMEKVGVYQMVQQNIQDNLDDLMLVNNIDRETMKQLISINEVKELVNQDVYALTAWLNGSGSGVNALDLSLYEERFDERIDTFFRDNHYFLDDSEKQDVELMKQNAMQIIKGNLRMLDYDKITSHPSLNQMIRLLSATTVKFAAAILGGIAFVLVLFLVLLSPRSKHQSRRKKVELGLLWSGYGVVAGGLMTFVLFFSGLQSGFYQHIAIQVNYLRASAAMIIETWFELLSRYGLITAGVGFLLMVPYWVKLYKKCMQMK